MEKPYPRKTRLSSGFYYDYTIISENLQKRNDLFTISLRGNLPIILLHPPRPIFPVLRGFPLYCRYRLSFPTYPVFET